MRRQNEMLSPYWPSGVRDERPNTSADKPPHARIPAFASRLLRLSKSIECYADHDLANVEPVPGRRSYYQMLTFEARLERYEELRSACFRLSMVAQQLERYVDRLFERPALEHFKARRERELSERDAMNDTMNGRPL